MKKMRMIMEKMKKKRNNLFDQSRNPLLPPLIETASNVPNQRLSLSELGKLRRKRLRGNENKRSRRGYLAYLNHNSSPRMTTKMRMRKTKKCRIVRRNRRSRVLEPSSRKLPRRTSELELLPQRSSCLVHSVLHSSLPLQTRTRRERVKLRITRKMEMMRMTMIERPCR